MRQAGRASSVPTRGRQCPKRIGRRFLSSKLNCSLNRALNGRQPSITTVFRRISSTYSFGQQSSLERELSNRSLPSRQYSSHTSEVRLVVVVPASARAFISC